MTVAAPLAALLAGPSRWHTHEHHEEVGSTNDLAAEAARRGVPAGLVVTADRQTAGRGRRGRTWEDQPAGRSLAVSMLVDVPPRHATLVPLATGLAAAEAYDRAGATAELKWPNDVLLPAAGGVAKAAGVLVERHDDHLVVGVGLNLDWRGVDRQGAAAAWTSLAESLDDDVDRWEVAADLLRSLDSWLRDVADDPAPLLAAYRSRCRTLGRRVRVETPAGPVHGEAVDVDDDGSLVLTADHGETRVTAGDVVHVR